MSVSEGVAGTFEGFVDVGIEGAVAGDFAILGTSWILGARAGVSGVSIKRLSGLVGVCRALFRRPAFQHLGGNVEVGHVFALLELVERVRDGGLVMAFESRPPESALEADILEADFFEAVQGRLEFGLGWGITSGWRGLGSEDNRRGDSCNRGQ
jgi:hypothetical protein